MKTKTKRKVWFGVGVVLLSGLFGAGPSSGREKAEPDLTKTGFQINRPIRDPGPRKAPTPAPARPVVSRPQPPTDAPSPVAASASASASAVTPDDPLFNPRDLARSPVVLFGLVSLAPVAVLMLTAFVRIHIVLVLLRQALGSPQVPGNQVLTALALMLTALVMRPVGEAVYARSIRPFAESRGTAADASKAYASAVGPVKAFMLEQIQRTHHEHYVYAIYDEVAPPGRPDPVDGEFPLGVVATAFLLSELTTALVIGFFLYLPFLVVDLVVSAVLAAMGLFMLPPSLVALPLKLILFVLVNGWVHVATVLLQSFGPVGVSP